MRRMEKVRKYQDNWGLTEGPGSLCPLSLQDMDQGARYGAGQGFLAPPLLGWQACAGWRGIALHLSSEEAEKEGPPLTVRAQMQKDRVRGSQGLWPLAIPWPKHCGSAGPVSWRMGTCGSSRVPSLSLEGTQRQVVRRAIPLTLSPASAYETRMGQKENHAFQRPLNSPGRGAGG